MLEFGVMVVYVVVGEGMCVILYGCFVGQVDIDMIQLWFMVVSGEIQDWQYCQNQCSELFFYQLVIFFGIGLVFFIWVQNGIRMKKVKYRMV